MSDYILEMKNITKEFPGVKALDDVSFKVKRGEIHCLCGENGAGKSTLMKVLSGVYPHKTYSGEILLNDKIQQYKKINDSKEAGIGIVYQELALIPEMTIYENIFLGNERANVGIINWDKTISDSKEQLKRVKLDLDPSTQVKELGIGKQQLVEIAKILSQDIKLLILDEPTSALNDSDSQNLLEIIKELKINHGVTSIMISHKLNEVLYIADSVTVLRDGKTIASFDKSQLSEALIIKHMVGREIQDIYPKRNTPIGNEILNVKNWSSYDKSQKQILKNININLKKGEVIGLAGLIGSGRTEFAHSIFGNYKNYINSGQLFLDNIQVHLTQPTDAIKHGMAYVSEDRKTDGLILSDDIKKNTSLANLNAITKSMLIDENKEINVANEYKNSMHTKAPSVEQLLKNLSGGNQQKVSISKWLFTNPKVLILDEPTRGIDVGAKLEIYQIINSLIKERELSVILISSELNEVIGMSDRIYVMSHGEITAEFSKEDATFEKIMKKAID